MNALLDFLIPIGALVLVLGVLVFVHEFGHFLAAKSFGVRVEVFSLGFGPRLFGRKRGDTDYRISGIPLGGYVRMSGEMGSDEAPSGEPDPAFFNAKPRWQRLIVMLAGPTMNVVLALGLWWGLFMHGTTVLDIPEGPPSVEAVEPGSPAAQAGLQPGDRILAIGDQETGSIEDYQRAFIFRPGQTVTYKIERGRQKLAREVTLGSHPRYEIGWDGVRVRIPILVKDVLPDGPAARAGVRAGDRILAVDGRVPSGDESVRKLIESAPGPVSMTLLRDGKEVVLTMTPGMKDGAHLVGITMMYPLKTVTYGAVEAVGASFRMAGEQAGLLFRTLSALVKRKVGLGVMSGPIEIARVSGEQARLGLIPLLSFMAFVSLQLGIFNLLPIPVLDGGNILILLIESALRRDVSTVVKERVIQVGFVLLVCFAVVVMFKDVGKMITRSGSPPAAQPAPATPPPQPAPQRP